ncbi:hypothetical protein EWM64_g7406 [Hericium alpestre]|uniref:beta-mannosidase n=1 Tax=Hericium alpestre TaxID=135208 RepID=A0A4Y9ZRD6_9AGAM|nr:hypothetical protein EWM64_g7406 [Hericium alpestre]
MYLDRDHKTTLDAVKYSYCISDSSSVSDMVYSPAKTVDLDKGWEWKQRNPSLAYARDEVALPFVPSGTDPVSGWHRASAFPSEIHVELLNEKLIPDPFIEFNEHKVQWVGLEEWLYKTTFPFEGGADGEHTELVFEGLDTFADVYLNGESILAADNQFRTWIVSLTFDQLKAENVLLLHFKSASKIAKELEAKYGRVRAGSTNLGDPSRVYVRKAQYDWRWDWGPELMTVAVPHPRYDAVQQHRRHPPCSHHAEGRAGVAIRTEGVTVSLASPDANGESETRGVVEWTFGMDEVALWWPVGYGAQALYNLEVILMDEVWRHRLRHEHAADRLPQHLARPGAARARGPVRQRQTFLFEVNGVRIFVGGAQTLSRSNWVPCDNFLTRVTPERLRAWLTLLRDGNQNMVRLWGGGVYEPDAFYDACDGKSHRLPMHAPANPVQSSASSSGRTSSLPAASTPAHAEFVESVRREAEDNVRRLRHHPSFALFCGNNEGTRPRI